MSWLYNKRIPYLPGFLSRYLRVIFSVDLPPSVQIGEGSKFVHNGLGCVINEQAIINKNVFIYQNVTIGGRDNRGVPIIEDDVFVGPGACLLGGITIGRGAVIGANAVVLSDVEPYTTVVGIPARSIPKKDKQ